MSRFLQRLRRKPVQEGLDPYGYLLHAYKMRFSLLGGVSAGKSTLAAGIVVGAETMSAQIPHFYCRVLPKSSHILTDANNLRLGRFPKKTDPYSPVAPEAGLLIGEKYSKKRLQVPICDIGGEVTDVLAATNPTLKQIERLRNINRTVVNHIRDSQGFIVVLPAPDALMFRVSHKSLDADSYLYTVLSQVMDHKLYRKEEIKAVAVWVTKCDQVQEEIHDLGLDLWGDPQNITQFMDNGFPALSMLLKPLRDRGKVKYFRSFFNLEKRDDGTPAEWGDGEKKIEVEEDITSYIKKKPVFSGQECVKFIRWAATFAR